jgi:hypothetical protein
VYGHLARRRDDHDGHRAQPTDHPEQRRIYMRVYPLINKLIEDVTATIAHGDQHIARSAHLAAHRVTADAPEPTTTKR